MSDLIFPGANHTRQWFADTYPGDQMTPNVIVLHTTEGGSWPSYAGGSEAPNLTIRPNMRRKRLEVRQHFPLDRSSRALVNAAGGVETNTLNDLQIELVGSCARKDGYGAIFWPDAPDWAINDLGEILATLHGVCPEIPLKDAAPRGWLPYPDSYGNSHGQRMSNHEWLHCYGIVGHQHVPENDHGDPGDLPIAKILASADPQTVERARSSKPQRVTRIDRARRRLNQSLRFLTAAVHHGRRGTVESARNLGRRMRRRLPKH